MTRRLGKQWLLATVLSGLFATYARGADYPFQDPSLPIDQRVNDLVRRMTAEEKISQMSMTAAAIPRQGQSRS